MPDERSEEERNRRANEKARKRKAVRDRILATKTLEKGLLIVHTGKGKGKSTAAFGLVARAIGNGLRTGVVQYVKGKWQTGERAVLERFPGQVDIHTMGEGFTWETQDRAPRHPGRAGRLGEVEGDDRGLPRRARPATTSSSSTS